jgi:hypothetical protein
MRIAFSEFFDRNMTIDGIFVAYRIDEEAKEVDFEVHASRADARRLHPQILSKLSMIGEGWKVWSHFAGGSSEMIYPAHH